MFELLASIYDEVKRLGFKGEAKVIKSWISLKLPHLREEALLVEDLFGLYQSVSTLPPQHVPKHVLTLRELSYSTAGKNVRQIIGEIGYILNSIYSRGYLKHNLLNMPDELRQRHIQFGVLLKDIVGLLGIYYNVSNKDEMIEEELSQVVEMYNTSIVSMLNKLSQELSSVEGATKQMLKGEANRHFLEENSEIAQKAEGFFKQIQELLLVIRSTFYHVRSKITSVNLKEVMVVLKQLRDFLRSLDELDSSLDFKNHNYSPQALAYWSVVFTKSKRKKTTKRLQRQQIVREMEEKPYLEDYSNVVEVSSQLLNTNAKNIMQSYRELNAYITTLIELNEKVYTSILNLASLETKIQGIIARLETLKTRVNLVKEDRNLTKAQKIKEVSSNLGYNLQNLFKQMREVFDSKLNFDDLLSFPYVPEIQRYQELSKILKGTINNLYEKIWMGPLDRDEINKFYSWILIIYQKLKEVSDNPIMHFEGYEKQLQEVFSSYPPINDSGEIAEGFLKSVKPFLSLPFFEKMEGSKEDKLEFLAKKVIDFNSIISSLITGNPIVLDDSSFGKLKDFVLKVNKEWRREVEKETEQMVEIYEPDLGKEGIFNTAVYNITSTSHKVSEWLSNFNIIGKKPSLENLLASNGKLENLLASNGKIFRKAQRDKAFHIPYIVRQEDGSEQEFSLELIVNQSLSILTIRVWSLINESHSMVSEKEMPLPTPQALFVQIRNFFSENKAVPVRDFNEISGNFHSWYTSFVPIQDEDEDEDEPFEEEIDFGEEMVSMEDESQEDQERKQKLQDLLRGKDLIPDPKKRKKVRQDISIFRTLKRNIRNLSESIPTQSTVSGYSESLTRKNSEFEVLFKRLLFFIEQSYSSLQSIVENVPDLFLESEDLLPIFPRLIYTIYDNVKTSSEAWKEWKTHKIELVLKELELLVNNLKFTDRFEEDVRRKIGVGVEGLPRATIDMTSAKFRELRQIVSD